MKLKVMTFNTQHCLSYIGGEIDYPLMAKAITDQEPDIVALNEMRDQGVMDGYDAQVAILAEKCGMEGYFAEAISFGGQNPYGNGLLSRFPIQKAEVFPIPVPDARPYTGYYEDRCLLKATLDIEGETFTVLVIHVGLNPDEAALAIETILANLPSERCILMGDFNLTPDSPILAPIFEKMQDAATQIKGEKFSYPSDKPRVKIDYIFVSPDAKVEDADIPALVASDHRPHVATVLF